MYFCLISLNRRFANELYKINEKLVGGFIMIDSDSLFFKINTKMYFQISL